MTLRRPYANLYFHPVKNLVGIFLADLLTKLLRDTPPDPALFRYIEGSLLLLDAMPGSVANFHITFLSGLTAMLGIAPDVSRPTGIFDMRAGCYVTLHPGHSDVLLGEHARIPLILSRLTFAGMHRLHLTRTQRAELLDGLLRYYAMHLPPIGKLNSMDILSQLFD